MKQITKEEALHLLAKWAGPLTVIYTRPHNKGLLKREATIPASDFIDEVKRLFSSERMEGRDFIVFLPECGKKLIGNHDGALYLE